ncbi:4Fe-4S binding protein [Pseudodesulfovibrio sp. zrk46]|uniref:4Fe-4S binding protein n=1 Tax=Pseudodesulfovibrio sp. zrk46 TaxID=2725288 RepID=UPI001449174D|nr:4Fe-4S binding protein [Pseudodesulfovibrio sp. zrk46]QJB55477.1 4Fe-4S binding protein [Pseudodesulfovibrio sp. zrk46]
MKDILTPSRFRLAVQAVFTLFCVYVGFRFVAFLDWAMGRSEVFVPKPGAVEGFLPISALLGLRQWISTGVWDTVHPAGLTIFLAILCMAVLFRKGFCGYICPVGFLSNLQERLGRKLGLAMVPHKYIDYPLTALKYGGLGFFVYIVFSMPARGVSEFINSPYNMVADAKMLDFFLAPSTLSLGVIAGLVVFGVVVRNAWCRYLCPYGALLGIVSWFSPTFIKRDADTCIGCGKCTKQCPSGIRVEGKLAVRTPECIGCAECVGACPVDGCLGFSVAGGGKAPWLLVGIGVVAVLLGFYVWAQLTGHWDADVPPSMFRKIYPMFLKMS